MRTELYKVWDYAKKNNDFMDETTINDHFNYIDWWLEDYITAEKEKKTFRLGLSRIKNKLLRRVLICITFPVLFLLNVILAIYHVCIFSWANQSELFISIKKTWNDNEL